MRWREIPRSSPKEGDGRYCEAFLLWPKRIGLEWRWLETGRWHEEFHWVKPYPKALMRRKPVWIPTAWADPFDGNPGPSAK